MSDKAGRTAIWLLVALGFSGLASLQTLGDKAGSDFTAKTKRATLESSQPLVPPLPVLQALSLGNPSLAADVLWLQTIQYFGIGDPDGKYPALGPLLNDITRLDPKDEPPYELGLVVLPFMDQSPQAIELGLRAQTAIPNNGLLTYYLASVYHLDYKDYQNAAKYYQLAAKEPGAPSAATSLAGTVLSKLDANSVDRIVAREFWRAVYQHATDPDQKANAKNWFETLDMVYNIEVAATNYKAKTGAYPSTQEQLVQAGLLSQVYTPPVNRLFILNPQTGKVNFDTLATDQ